MERATVRVDPQALAKLFNLAEVEHVAVRVGLIGVPTIMLTVRDPRIPKGVEELEVLIHRAPNGSYRFAWRPKGMQTIIESPPLLVTP